MGQVQVVHQVTTVDAENQLNASLCLSDVFVGGMTAEGRLAQLVRVWPYCNNTKVTGLIPVPARRSCSRYKDG